MHSDNPAFLLPHSHTFTFFDIIFYIFFCVCPLTTYWLLKLSSLKKKNKKQCSFSLSFLVQFEWLPLLCFLVFWPLPRYDPTYCWCLWLYFKILLLCFAIPFDSCLYFLSVKLSTCRAMYCVIWGYIMIGLKDRLYPHRSYIVH